MGDAALGASPLPVRKVKRLDAQAGMAGFGGWEPSSRLHHLTAAPEALVVQHPSEIAHCRVRPRLAVSSQFGSHESGQVQVFEADGVVTGHKTVREFV